MGNEISQKIVIRQAIKTTLPILKKSEFEKIIMPKPPKLLQNKFTKIIETKTGIIKQLKKQSEESSILLYSLTQRAFRGEL